MSTRFICPSFRPSAKLLIQHDKLSCFYTVAGTLGSWGVKAHPGGCRRAFCLEISKMPEWVSPGHICTPLKALSEDNIKLSSQCFIWCKQMLLAAVVTCMINHICQTPECKCYILKKSKKVPKCNLKCWKCVCKLSCLSVCRCWEV